MSLVVAVDGRVVQDVYHGIGRWTFEVVSALSRRGVRVDLLTGAAPATRLRPTDLLGLPGVRDVPFRAPIVSLQEKRAWPAMLRSLTADVLLVPYHLAAPWNRGSLPLVPVVHDCIFERRPEALPRGLPPWLYRRLTSAALRSATTVATVSHATRSELHALYGLRVQSEAVWRSAVGREFSERAGTDDHSQPSVPAGRRYVLMVGARRPHKNHVTVVRAFAALRDELPDTDLVIVGSADPRTHDDVPQEVARLGLDGRVHVVSDVGDVEIRRLYRRAAVFAFPSLVEGFGLPVLEAMASGAPVVASDAEAVTEAAGGAALTVPALDVGAWADALRCVLTDGALSARLRDAGAQVASSRSWDDVGAEVQLLLEDVAR